MADLNELVYKAKLAEQAERYDEMASHMAAVARLDGERSADERNLLSVAFKNAVGSRRAAWRILTSVVAKEQANGNAQHQAWAEEYRRKIEVELDTLCNDLLSVLDILIKNAPRPEAEIFYVKMMGDYYRYVAERSENPDKNSGPTLKAREAYARATESAKQELAVTHPVRLGLALNSSVFMYEVLHDAEGACTVVRNAFEDAIADLDNVPEEQYKDATLIMQLLRDNLTLWTSEQEDAAAGG